MLPRMLCFANVYKATKRPTRHPDSKSLRVSNSISNSVPSRTSSKCVGTIQECVQMQVTITLIDSICSLVLQQ